MQKLLQINDSGKTNVIELKSDSDFFILSMDLANLIINKYENNIISSIIKKHYNYLEDDEQKFVKEKSKKKLDEHRTEIQTYIFEEIALFIRSENIINVMGFITFRLKEYILQIENAIDSALNEFVIEREYEQLINGLTIYIELQVPLIDTINVIQIKSKYIISDKNGNEIFTLTNYDDVLLDVMLTLAPRKIIIYNADYFKNKELLDTIFKVFGKRVILVNSTENSSK